MAAAWAEAREHGLATLTLRQLAARIGMSAPSLYTHFAAKHAIYDAMFADAWRDVERIRSAMVLPAEPRRRCAPWPGRSSTFPPPTCRGTS